MTTYQLIINLAAYSVFLSGSWLAWPSRYNLPATTELPFVVTAYLVPMALIPFSDIYSTETVELLTNINAVGGLAMLVGIIIGAKLKFSAKWLAHVLPVMRSVSDERILRRRLRYGLGFGVLGMIACFSWMGVVPMFADDPFLAKFFKGSYKDKYDQVSVLYRLAQFAVITLLPLGVTISLERKDIRTGLVVLASMSVLALSLTRAPVVEGVLLFLAVLATRSLKATMLVLAASTLIYLAGSVIYLVLGLVEGGGDLVENLTYGAPDILDHLSFLSKFNLDTDLTYGLTFVGGLVPGGQPYNPSVYSLAISNPSADIVDISSGGFRMPPSMWGYASFSWPGVVVVCLLSGLVLGGATMALKRIKFEESLTNKMLLILWFQIVVGFVANFFSMFYYGLLSIVLFVAVTRIRRKKSNAVQ